MTDSTQHLALITGGSRGLGRASALALAKAGSDVVITYRSSADEAAAVVAQIEGLGRRAAALRLDTSRGDEFPDFADELGRVLADVFGRDTIDALVNNAGTAGSTPFGSTTADELDRLFSEHVKGVFLLTQTLAPRIADGGRILNTSSGLARFTSPGNYSGYGAMKAAVEALTRYWAVELGGRGIAVNVVAPGPIATDFAGGLVRDTPRLRDAMAQQAALGRVGEADDIGGVVATLLTGDVQWITGQRIEASGGMKL